MNLPNPPDSLLTAKERAEAIHSLIRRKEKHTPESLAEKIARPIAWVNDHLRLYDEIHSR